MIAVRDVEVSPAAQTALIAVVEILQPVEVMQVPHDGRVFAVDLQGVEGLVAAGVARGFEGGQGAVLKARQKQAGIVDRDRFHFAGHVMLAILDEGFGERGNFIDRAVEPHGGVDGVGQQVASDAAAGDGGVQAPETFAALGQVARDGPVLKKFRAVMEYPAQAAFVDQLLRQSDRGHPAIVVPDHVGTPAASTAATIASDSAAFRPRGFSHITILPALAAAIAISACVSLGLAMSMRSISGESTSLRQSVTADW